MCGIAGFTAFAPDRKGNKALLRRMLDRIVHRGPDHRGSYITPSIALGSQRLKIIDLEGGNQPIENEDGTIVVVYNGEIYNFRELRADLIRAGHQFKTRCDTEILVHLYEDHGAGMLPMINGMFAFALYDKSKGEVLLARDRFGIKPLFYTKTTHGIYFASEVNALRVAPGFSTELDYQALVTFLAQFYIPSPWSIFRHVQRLRPGHYVMIRGGKMEQTSYYDFDFSKKADITAPEARDELVRLVSRSVDRQLVSDVPVAVFLSSGLDSACVLAMAAEAGGKLASLTLSFEESVYDENPQAVRWANLFAREHHRIMMSETDFLERLENRLTHTGEPTGPWINVGAEFLATEARKLGFKVVLTGAGGDELFCGYPTLNAAVLARTYRLVPEVLRKHVIAPFVNMLPAGSGPLPATFLLKSFASAVEKDDFRTFFNFKRVIPASGFPGLLTDEIYDKVQDVCPYLAFEQYKDRTAGYHLVDALSYVDLKTFLEGCILHLGDNASMAASLEQRVPFLDNDLAEFASSLPVKTRFNVFRVKPLLQAGIRDYLERMGAADLTRSYKKRGFELPVNKWIRNGKVADRVRDRLAAKALADEGFFRPDTVRTLLDDHAAGKQNNERLIQAIMAVSVFLKTL